MSRIPSMAGRRPGVLSPSIGWLALLLTLSLPAANAANTCKLTMFRLPVRMEDRRPVISGTVNGTRERFIVDTGSFFDFLSPTVAAALKLPLAYAPPWYRVIGVGGSSFVPQIATVKTFTVAGITGRDAQFLVGDNDFQGGIAGILGQNLFRATDVDFDFADGLLRFVEPQHCGGRVLAYWATTQPIGMVDFHWTTEQQPNVIAAAAVNGHRVNVLFDTGSWRTILSLSAARHAGITPSSPGVVPAGMSIGLGGRAVKVWVAPIDKFEIGGEAIEHTHVLIGDIGLPQADMLLGADFFLAHHIYIAYSQDKLYFTYNGGPVFDLNTASPAQAKAASTNTPAAPTAAAPMAGASAQPAVPAHAPGSPTSSAAAGQAHESNAPSDPGELLRRGMAETSRGELAQAIADLTRACELEPADASCRYQRGLAYWHDGNTQLALADFDDALKLAPADYDAHLARAELQLPQLHTGVEADLDAVDRLAPPEADLRLQLAGQYGSIGAYAAAAHQLDLWIQHHPRDVRLPGALGSRCWARAAANIELDQALSDCARAASMEAAQAHSALWRLTHRNGPDPSWLLRNRSLVYLRLGDLDKAIADDDAALGQLEPKDPQTAYLLYLRGLAEVRKGSTSQGQADLAQARHLQPAIDKHYASMGLTP
jgi:tetratricopeptide (TPR) repeat protein/predicted aspartyl protease